MRGTRSSPCFTSGTHYYLKSLVLVALLLAVLPIPACARPPQAELGASVTSGPSPLAVSFNNTSRNADEFRWDFGDGATMTTGTVGEPVAHEYTRAGNYTVTLTAIQGREPPESSTANLTVTVEHGRLDRVKLSPDRVGLDIGQSQEFTAEAVDAYGNPIPEAQLTWGVVEEAGTVTPLGRLTAGTKAGTFDEAVAVTARLGEYSADTTASVTVNPDPMASVTVSRIEVGAGETQRLEAIPRDQYGNRLSDVETAWTGTDQEAGSVTGAGLFSAGEIAGSYAAAVRVEVAQGELLRTASAGVTITPGPLEQVVIAPDSTKVGMEMTQQFVAVGADRYGNRISGLGFNWSVENGEGTIDEAGLFTAGTTPGTYKDSVKATATEGDTTRSATADVTVEPDRIVFQSNGDNDEQWDLYIMDVDGDNQEQLTTSGVEVGYHSCSPDGRRIIYGASGDILTINDDGTWSMALLSGRSAYEPAWSPDGSKIAFQSWEHDPSEIYVMDVDGGNLVRLTNNSDYDDYPAWSPDGTRIAFVSDRDGDVEIYVMSADGGNLRQLTSDSAWDGFPAWSPDGREILFQSSRSGDVYAIYVMNADGTNVRRLTSTDYFSHCPYWSPDGTKVVFHSWQDPEQTEIYIMDRDGSNMTRLTSNSANDYLPRWMPRKRGVEVTEASVIVPDTSTHRAMMTQEVTAQAREAVVRIETDLSSGSGFFISSDGLILTNNHVIRDAGEITVYLEDGTSYDGTVEARDLVHDLALVKIETSGLTCLEMGDLSQVGLGQQVIVLGYPLGGENVTVTSGLVSAIEFDSGRNITWVQTDSAVNPGNSGGPMLTLQGKVIGVVSAKMVGIAVEGIGFAISANTVNTYLPRMEAGETIVAFPVEAWVVNMPAPA